MTTFLLELSQPNTMFVVYASEGVHAVPSTTEITPSSYSRLLRESLPGRGGNFDCVKLYKE